MSQCCICVGFRLQLSYITTNNCVAIVSPHYQNVFTQDISPLDLEPPLCLDPAQCWHWPRVFRLGLSLLYLRGLDIFYLHCGTWSRINPILSGGALEYSPAWTSSPQMDWQIIEIPQIEYLMASQPIFCIAGHLQHLSLHPCGLWRILRRFYCIKQSE